MYFAMSFPLWRCREDGLHVEWADAAFEVDDSGRLVAVRHKDCA